MSEKDKMLAGEIYNANYDEELIKERIKVKISALNITIYASMFSFSCTISQIKSAVFSIPSVSLLMQIS